MLEGLAMLIHTSNFPGKDMILEQNGKTWGWFQIIVGAALLLSGFAVFSGNVLGRTVGVIAATVSALGAFSTVQFQPVWNTAIIAVDIAIIWALTAHGRDIKKLDDLDA
jgi:predicted phage tail protein